MSKILKRWMSKGTSHQYTKNSNSNYFKFILDKYHNALNKEGVKDGKKKF